MALIKRPLPLPLRSGQTRVSKASIERLVNFYPEAQAAGAESQVALIPSPGCKLDVELPGDDGIKGYGDMDNRRFVITDTNLYEIRNTSYIDHGSLIIRGRCTWATNGIHFVFVDGFKGYVYDDARGLREITDEGFYPSTHVIYQDGRFIFLRKGTGQFFISGVLSVDFDATEFATAEGSPDDTIAMLNDHLEVWLFGERSIEIWYNSGAQDFPYERLRGGYVEKGIAGPYLAGKDDNTVFWVGNDRMVYRAEGYSPVRISTHAVEKDLNGADMSGANLINYTLEGHTFVHINIPSLKKAWVYDMATQEWHERVSLDYGTPIFSHALEFQGEVFVGGNFINRIYRLDLDYDFDDETIIPGELVCPPIFDNANRIRLASLEMQMQVDLTKELVKERNNPAACDNTRFQAKLPTPGVQPVVTMDYTDDQGATWSRPDDQPYGIYNKPDLRVKWNKLGSFYERSFRFRIYEPIRAPIVGLYWQ